MNEAEQITETARRQFDRQAAHYNERWASWSDESLRRVLEVADPQAHDRVLDVATAGGFTGLAFAPHVAHVTGMDISNGMLMQAAKRAGEQSIVNVDWVQADAHALPFADGSFELVTVRIAAHHFADVPQFLREVRRVLVPNGAFVVCDTTVPDDAPDAADWQNRTEKLRDSSHVANLSPNTWKYLCNAAGLSVTESEATQGGIPIEIDAWLETSGCDGAQADAVRSQFANAPESARQAFQIVGQGESGTHFVWQRVVLRAVVKSGEG